ncbi:hypothetical protein BKA70DRAFT_71651 [Coprinopsis sp. MPI-PUGE-AT-0042]|nr:hypothetical protein BKA70DRAFT_71651 [Coprinopsis sp. MPI-PUGE-AT-0042]
MFQQQFRLKPARRKQQSKGSRSTALIQGTRQAQFNDGSFTVVGGDSITHIHHHEATVSLESILRAIPSFRKIHQDMLAKATSVTGMWLLKSEIFSLWLEPNGDLKILWGSGIPGAGKTILTALVIDLLEELARESGRKTCVAYIYIRYSDRANMTVRNVLEVLVKQIAERHPDALPIVYETYALHISDATQPTESQLLGLLRQLADYVTTTFVIDALDEAPTDMQLHLVKTLDSLNCKMFITSRPLAVVEEQFPDAHRLLVVAQDGDIDLLIEKKLERSANLQRLFGKAGSSLREEIVGTIKRKCGGMFLHASLQLDALCHCLSLHDVHQTLDQFPSEIENTYAQTWSRILNQHPRHVSLAKAVLLWVVNAARSVTVEELQRAVATSPHNHKFEPARMVPETTFLGLCHGLVVLEEESRLVRLVHYTARKPVEESLLESFPHPHSLQASICMTHLTKCEFESTTIDSKQALEQALKDDPLLAYSHDAWAFHAQASLDDMAVASQLAEFVTNCHAFPALISGTFDLLSPLHLLIFYQLPLSFARPLNDGVLNVVTKIYGYTPMGLAGSQGYRVGVQALLLLAGDSINKQDKTGASPLIYAAWHGHEGAVELLLACPKISVNLVNQYGISALMLAAYNGHRTIVKLLLAHPEIEVNPVTPAGTSALIDAATSGDLGTFELLLAHPEIQVNQQTVSA